MIYLNFVKTDFTCPHCNKSYNDLDDKYLKRCNNSKIGVTRINCSCGDFFYFTYDYMGNSSTFKRFEK